MASYYTAVGKTVVVDRIDATQAGSNADYIGSGTGATAASTSSTTIASEVTEARASTVKSQPTTDKNQWVGTYTATGTKTITNAGVFDTSSSGNLILVADGLSIAVINGDSVQYTFTLQQT